MWKSSLFLAIFCFWIFCSLFSSPILWAAVFLHARTELFRSSVDHRLLTITSEALSTDFQSLSKPFHPPTSQHLSASISTAIHRSSMRIAPNDRPLTKPVLNSQWCRQWTTCSSRSVSVWHWKQVKSLSWVALVVAKNSNSLNSEWVWLA